MTALLGRWNTGRWGKPLRTGAPGWWRGRTRLIYVHLTEAEWQAVDEAARIEGVTREQWLVRVSQTALACPSGRVAQTVAADAAAAHRLQARRDAR